MLQENMRCERLKSVGGCQEKRSPEGKVNRPERNKALVKQKKTKAYLSQRSVGTKKMKKKRGAGRNKKKNPKLGSREGS